MRRTAVERAHRGHFGHQRLRDGGLGQLRWRLWPPAPPPRVPVGHGMRLMGVAMVLFKVGVSCYAAVLSDAKLKGFSSMPPACIEPYGPII